MDRERPRSESPTLESWIARRDQAKEGEKEKPSRRASSLPSRREQAQRDKPKPVARPQVDSLLTRLQQQQFSRMVQDRRAWDEIRDDDEGEEGRAEDELFQQLQQEEQKRLKQ